MKLHDLLEMSAKDIESAEDMLKRKFLSASIILNFTKHFADRIIDGARDEHVARDNITVREMIDVFAKIYSRHNQIFKQAADFQDELKRGEFEGVIKDLMLKINISYGLEFNKSRGKYVMTCITIMKRDKFKTKNTDHVVEV